MDLSFFPQKIIDALKMLDYNFLYQIRLRTNYQIKINYNYQNLYLSVNGIEKYKDNGIICTKEDIEYIIDKVTEHSIYAYNDQIKNGYITTKSGIRIGLAGECVFCDDNIKTIKNFTSLNIRIPHKIIGCAKEFLKHIYDGTSLYNTLIVSPPFLGKTTLLKDIAQNLNDINIASILIIDERGEFVDVSGENIDKISYVTKNYAFNFAIRALSPTIIITDELNSEDDWLCAYNCINCGSKIIASCHSDNITNLKNKQFFISDVFDKYIILNNLGFGQIKSIYDKEYNRKWG